MPYIKKERREKIDPYLIPFIDNIMDFEIGDLNYIMSKLINARFEKMPSYSNANALIGVFEAAKLEFYRRKVAPYEDLKIEQNGDV